MTPVTVIEAGPCPVVAVRTPDVDGYTAVQLAFRPCKEKKLTRPRAGHLKAAGVGAAPHVDRVPRRRRGPRAGRHRHGRGVRARRGGQGVGHLQGQGLRGNDQAAQFHRGPVSHGSHNVRKPGSIGASAYPARVFKGMQDGGPDGERARHPARPAASPTSTPSATCSWSAGAVPGRSAASSRSGARHDASRSDRGGHHRRREGEARRRRVRASRNDALVHQVVTAELAARRQGTHSTKTRGLVAGGRAKPWRQKGTGRARQGTTRAPQWTGGGVVFGPHPRSYTGKVNKKARAKALSIALSAHADRRHARRRRCGAFDEPKTKKAAAARRRARPRDAARGRDRRGRGPRSSGRSATFTAPTCAGRRARGRRGRLGAARSWSPRPRSRCSRGAQE